MFRKKERKSDTEITELLIIISPDTLTVAQVKKKKHFEIKFVNKMENQKQNTSKRNKNNNNKQE